MQVSTLQSRCSLQQALCIVGAIQLAALINIKGSTGLNLNDTHSSSSSSSAGVHQSGLASKSSSPTLDSMKAYANHRMDEDDSATSIKSVLASATTNNKNSSASASHSDREAASSILRPQLALQIYTNPSPHDAVIRGSAMFPRGFGPTMFIVPVQHKLPDDFQLTSATNQVRHPHHSHSKSNLGKINQWRYLTYQGNNLLEGSSANGLAGEAYHASAGPLINTIISVPTSGEHQTSLLHQHHHRHRSHLSPQASLQEEESKSSSGVDAADQPIAKLLESQLAGNLEFTMNLNGEEITFNPATNKARITRSKSKPDPIEAGDSDDVVGQPSIKRSSSRSGKDAGGAGRRNSRAPVDQADQQLIGDQQSASDIDLTDSVNDEDEADLEYDRLSSPNPPKHDDKLMKQRASDDNDLPERDEKSAGSGQNRHWPMDVGEDADERDPDELGVYESSSDNQLTKAKKSRDSSGDSSSSSKRGDRSKVTKTGGRKSSLSSMGRKAQGSRKRVVHKNSDQAAGGDDKSDLEKDDVPSVMIKSDDVRRFEQLLENLRSISLSTQAAKNRRSGGKSSGRQKQVAVSADAEDDGKEEDFEGGGGEGTKSEPAQAQPKSASDSGATDTSDCDRKRHKSSASDDDGGSSYDLDSSPNTMDQEPANQSDADNERDSQDSQTGEQEEQSRNHLQKVAAPGNSGSQGDKQQAGQRGSSSSANSGAASKEKQAKSVVLRKTVVQSYYNEDGDQMASQRDNIRSSYGPQQHEAAQQNESAQMSKPPSQYAGPPHRESNHHQQDHSSASVMRRLPDTYNHQSGDHHYPLDGLHSPYSGYHQNHQMAEHREAIRASESQRVKTVIVPKLLTMRKIRPLQEMIGKALMKPTGAMRAV